MMMQKIHYLTGIILITLAAGAGCSTVIERIPADEIIDIGSSWNDTDSRLVAREMVSVILFSNQDNGVVWWEKFQTRNRGRKPVVIVGRMKNLSHEHINIRTFVKDIEYELINFDQIEVVVTRDEREPLVEERLYQLSHVSGKTAVKLKEEVGADFLLTGEINTIMQSNEARNLIYYQVTMELTNIETGIKAWAGMKKIKKLTKRPRLTL
jgi:penicillin-binding protein activator